MEGLRKLSLTLSRYPNAQASYFLHKIRFNAKINYWMRAQYPACATPFVDDFKEDQTKLVIVFIVSNGYPIITCKAPEIDELNNDIVVGIILFDSSIDYFLYTIELHM